MTAYCLDGQRFILLRAELMVVMVRNTALRLIALQKSPRWGNTSNPRILK